MSETDIPFPRRGLNDNWAFSDQPGETTRSAQNVRSVDPTNGRTRGSQRAGMSKHLAEMVGSGSPVRMVRSAVYDSKAITYEALQGDLDTGDLGLTEEVWAKTAEAAAPVRNQAVDTSGNVYSLAGDSIEKRNGSGVLQWTYTVPLSGEGFVLEPLVVAADLAIYVAISSGTKGQEGATIYKIDQIPVANTFDTDPSLAWAWQVDRWVRELVLHQGALRCLLQDDSKYRAYVMTLAGLTLASPIEQGEIEVPYPATCMVVKDDGSLVTGHPPFADRDSSPGHPGVGISLEQWNSTLIEDYANRVWAEYRASDLAGTLSDGQLVEFWPDRTGHGRDLAIGPTWDAPDHPPHPGPTFKLDGPTGSPATRWKATTHLASPPGGGFETARDSCLSMLPNHGDGAYCLMMVCRLGAPLDDEIPDNEENFAIARSYLIQQMHHGFNSGAVTTKYTIKKTKAHRSGIIVNSKVPTATTANMYQWAGYQSNLIMGDLSTGDLRAFTSSSGLHDTTSDSSGSTDVGFMPTHRGAGNGGWPKEGQFFDSTSDDPAEGYCVLTFMHCGGLDEATEVAGTYTANAFVADSSTAFRHLPPGVTGQMYIGGTAYSMDLTGTGADYDDSSNEIALTGAFANYSFVSGDEMTITAPAGYEGTYEIVTRVSDDEVILGSDPGVTVAGTVEFFVNAKPGGHDTLRFTNSTGPSGSGTAYFVPERNWMTRSTLRINGTPVDRWEALPMSYAGADSSSVPAINKNVQASRTSIGKVMNSDSSALNIGFSGEIMEMEVFGRRQRNSDRVTLGGTEYVLWPSVLTHPLYAENGHVNDVGGDNTAGSDRAFYDVGSQANSTEVERLEGEKAHRHGIALRLPPITETHPHPHYPVVSGAAYGLPYPTDSVFSNQARVDRKRETGGMIVKHKPSGSMEWCLVSPQPGSDYGDIVTQDMNGSPGVLGITDGSPTSGLALDSTGSIFFCGPGNSTKPNENSEEFSMGVITDAPLTAENPQLVSVGFYSISGRVPSSLFKLGLAADVTVRPKTDAFDNFYVPVHPGTQYLAADAPDAVRVYGRAEVTDDYRPILRLTTLGGTTKYQNAYSIALPPANPEYQV